MTSGLALSTQSYTGTTNAGTADRERQTAGEGEGEGEGEGDRERGGEMPRYRNPMTTWGGRDADADADADACKAYIHTKLRDSHYIRSIGNAKGYRAGCEQF